MFGGIVAVIILIVLDQLTKVWAQTILAGKDIPLIKGVLEFHYLENQSAAFSMDPISLLQKIFHFAAWDDPAAFLNAKMTFFTILTIVIAIGILVIYYRVPSTKHFLPLNIILVAFISGAIGNLIDRMTHRYVVDFIYFKLIDFPVFNVADIYVTCASFALIYYILFFYKDHDFEQIFPSRRKKAQEEK